MATANVDTGTSLPGPEPAGNNCIICGGKKTMIDRNLDAHPFCTKQQAVRKKLAEGQELTEFEQGLLRYKPLGE